MPLNPVNDVLTSNGDTTEAIESVGGLVHFLCTGTFDSGTLKAEFSPDGGTTWFTETTTAYHKTDVGMLSYPVPPRFKTRLKLSGATAPNITVYRV